MYSEYDFFSANHRMKKVVEEFCEALMEVYGLRKVELDILYFVAHGGAHVTAKDIIRTRHISKAHISKSVDNLRRKGYIQLIEDEEDHRCFCIFITEKGKPVISEFEQMRQRIYEILFSGVTEEEKLCMQSAFRKIASNIDEVKKEKRRNKVMNQYGEFGRETEELVKICQQNNQIPAGLFEEFGVKRGLRDKDGNGVLSGITNISRIDAFRNVDGKKIPCDGELWYRGYNVINLIKGFEGKRYGFEEVAYLLLFGDLPDNNRLLAFQKILEECRQLPTNFMRDVIMKAPSRDLMNSLTRSVLTLASYDETITNQDLQTQLEQCIKLISVFPMLSVYGYHAYNHYLRDESLYIHRPKEGLSAAENILLMLRPDKKYSALEAQVLDIALVLHMEHGGGNNSTFTTRVVTSSGSDTYSVMAAALSSLKGPKHGGANIKVVEMMADMEEHISDWKDEDAVKCYLEKLVDKEAFDKKGLIYGMGHAVYSLSDPRAQVFKHFVERLALEKGRAKDFALYSMVEKLAPEVIAEKRHIYKGVSANVDFYSGFVYSMLDIPLELYTPIFAIARIVGWSAHRMEELVNMDKIIRPAYKSIMTENEYKDLDLR